jgi:transposase InsO family protein
VLHANAALTPRQRLSLARLIVEEKWTAARAAERFGVASTTARRWAARYRTDGKAGMQDRSSRPHSSPAKTDAATTKRIVSLRLRKRWGAVRLAAETGVAPSTAGAVLRRCRISRLSRLERRERPPATRYEHPEPGDLRHVDVKKLGNIPAGGGWRFLGRAQGKTNRITDGGKARSRHCNVLMRHGFIHVVLDDHSRLTYAEIHDDELAVTAAGVLRRAVAWFAARGVTAYRVLTDNGGCYRSRAWATACIELGITPKRTRPYRPQTNGKVERFNRTMTSEWAFAQLFTSEEDRRAAFPAWLHTYNHHRPHTGIGGHPPISRLTNLSGQYTYAPSRAARRTACSTVRSSHAVTRPVRPARRRRSSESTRRSSTTPSRRTSPRRRRPRWQPLSGPSPRPRSPTPRDPRPGSGCRPGRWWPLVT